MVDRKLATSAPDVYALGDCAEINGVWLPYSRPFTTKSRHWRVC